jgi:virginiamycin B lyase
MTRRIIAWLILALTASHVIAQEPKDPAEAVPPMAPDNLTLEIREWTVPWEATRPRDPDVAPNGTVWLVGQGGDYVAHFDPQGEEFKRFELPPGTGPHNIIVDRDASLWVAGNRQGWIGRMNPNTGNLTRYSMPDEAIQDPHTMVFTGQGQIWFTAQWSNVIGRLNQRGGKVDWVEVPIEKSRPYGIRLDSAGRPWVALLGTNALATVDPESMELQVVYTPRAESRLRRLAITSDDAVWYTDYSEGWLGRYEPATGEFSEWRNPSVQSGPYAIASDARDRIWLVETFPQPNQFVGFDPEEEVFFSRTAVPSGGGAVRHMVYDAERNVIWFGTDSNMLGQAILPP